MKTIFKIALLIAACLTGLSGCMAPPNVGLIISESIRKSEEGATQRGSLLVAQHLKLIESLRAEGDPMGEYLWTRANADGWVSNPISDPLVLKAMYEAAATKGSVDAQHVLGLMLIDGSASRTAVYESGAVLRPDDRDWQKGLALIEEATKKQCWYSAPILDGMANKTCLRAAVAPGVIWPKFRDGRTVPLDLFQMDKWQQLELSCRRFLQDQGPGFFYRKKFEICR